MNSALAVLKDDRERYDRHLKTGMPVYAHGAYYYQSWRPSVPTVLAFLILISGFIQYVSNWIMHLTRQEPFDDILSVADLPIKKLAKELERRGIQMTKKEMENRKQVAKALENEKDLKGVHYLHPKPNITDVWFIHLPLRI